LRGKCEKISYEMHRNSGRSSEIDYFNHSYQLWVFEVRVTSKSLLEEGQGVGFFQASVNCSS